MANEQTYVLMLYLAQAASALVLAALFGYFWRIYQRQYLAFWGFSFLAGTFYLAAGGLALILAPHFSATHPYRLGATLVSQCGVYLQIVLLALGTLAVVRERALSGAALGRLLSLAVLLGVGASLAFAFDPAAVPERILVRVGLRYLLTGLVCLAVGLMLLRGEGWQAGFGRRLVGIAFLVYGAELLHVFALSVWQFGSGRAVSWGLAVGLIDLVAMLLIGLALVIWLLEEERERSDAAGRALRRLSLYDPLTGLANRRLFLERLETRLHNLAEGGRTLAVLFVDLDRFRVVNDSVGHGQGDQLLMVMAERLEQFAADAGGLAGRSDADKFALFTPLVTPEQAEALGRRLLFLVARPVALMGPAAAGAQPSLSVSSRTESPDSVTTADTLREPESHAAVVTCSVGIALFPDDGSDPERLLNHADLAAQSAKRQGGDQLQFFAPELNRSASDRLALHVDLHRALAQEEFEVFFQPIMAAGDGRLVRVEALLRWRHPRYGLRTPDSFLQGLVEIGAMARLDLWVLDRAAKQVQHWRETCAPGLRLATNLSARSFSSPDLAKSVAAVLASSQLPPDALELEITEADAMDSIELTVEKLHSLRRVGVRVALDDFGIGYSSMAQLRHLPVDVIKIDRSFVRDVLEDDKDAAVVTCLAALAQSLRLEVVAEGVEQSAQARYLREIGVDYMQGFLYHPALPAPELERLLCLQPRAVA